ncbi:MAG: hypothetical protein IJS86_07955 [Lachnospiraceae bacterium]|nr:hypothetical protein [Lachnospiraceae bacterium]
MKVSFYSRKDEKGNWIKVAESSVYEKQFVTEPKLEEPEGEEFAGWYRTEDYSDDGFSVHQRVTEEMELFARWISSDETVTKKSGELGSGEISYELEYTPEVIYDGRKHVVSEVNGKKTAETASVNPDINVSNFKVLINGEKVSGITIKKFTYANNKLPSYDGVTNNPMFIYPVLKYDTSDQGYRDAIAANPDLKKVLNKMMKPTYNKKNEEWNYEPITVDIHRITLSSETPVYTKADLNSNAELKKTDGILVWNGGKITYKTKKYGRGEDAQTYTLKAAAKGLYYQRVFDIGSKKVVKKLTLRPGEWTVKTAREDGEIYRYLAMKTKAFDYYVGEDGELLLNGDTEIWSSDEGNGTSGSIKAGYFDGDLPDLKATE